MDERVNRSNYLGLGDKGKTFEIVVMSVWGDGDTGGIHGTFETQVYLRRMIDNCQGLAELQCHSKCKERRGIMIDLIGDVEWGNDWILADPGANYHARWSLPFVPFELTNRNADLSILSDYSNSLLKVKIRSYNCVLVLLYIYIYKLFGI